MKEEAITELAQAVALLWRRVRAASADEHEGLTITHSSVLARLAKLGPMTTADLARVESMKPQSMGTVVGTLEELGLVAREPHPTDGRQLLVTLTPAGATMRKKVREAKLSWLASAIGKLDRDEQAKLFAASAVLKKLAET